MNGAVAGCPFCAGGRDLQPHFMLVLPVGWEEVEEMLQKLERVVNSLRIIDN